LWREEKKYFSTKKKVNVYFGYGSEKQKAYHSMDRTLTILGPVVAVLTIGCLIGAAIFLISMRHEPQLTTFCGVDSLSM
jgi:hypothetical protein